MISEQSEKVSASHFHGRQSNRRLHLIMRLNEHMANDFKGREVDRILKKIIFINSNEGIENKIKNLFCFRKIGI